MNKQELKEKFVELVQSILPNFKDKFTDAKLADGTLVTYEAEEIAVGVLVMVVDTNGAKMPLPVGSYVMEDGTTFDIVDELGSADNVVKAPEAPEAEETPAMPPAAQSTEQAAAPVVPAAAKSIIESTVKETRFTADEKAELELAFEVEKEKLSKEVEELKTKLAKQEETVKAMMTLVEGMGNEPSTPSTETQKNVFKKPTIKELRESFKKQVGN